MYKLLFIFLYVLLVMQGQGQDSTVLDKWQIGGYLKAVEMYTDNKMNSLSYANHFIHNRINLKWKPSSILSFSGEFRNRLFLGEQKNLVPNFAATLRNQNEFINLQKAWIENKQLVFHTNVERLYVDFNQNKWNLRAGRQRINWGMANTWNPNDIFNAYNFLDIDYVERPGSDAAKLKYIIHENAHAELVYSRDIKQNNIVATKVYFNKWDYDFQLIAGSYMGNITLGAGWAGSISKAGLKGELQYYEGNHQQKSQLNLAIGFDYMFKKAWYLNIGALYNSNGLDRPVTNWQNLNLNLSARNLMPAKFSFISALQKELSPLSSTSLSLVYSPGIQLWILMPSITYNLSNSLDADLLCQIFYLRTDEKVRNASNIGFLRLRYNF